MTTTHLKELLDSCFTAKRITESMADLPKGMKPRHIHVIDAIYQLILLTGEVRVSDVSRRLNITTPSVTKLISELVFMDAVTKTETGEDRRFTLLGLTDKGLAYEQRYVTDYHALWAEKMTEITDEEVKTAIRVIAALKKAIPKGGGDLE